MTQRELLIEYYKKYPNKDIKHKDAVDWATAEWLEREGEVFRDPDRGIRKLYEEGFLIKVKKGVYKYDPNAVKNKKLEDFTEKQKQEILKKDGYKCVICGQGRREGMELHVDHMEPKERGGKAIVENGQTLCSAHNMMKKNLKQTEAGKKMFIRLYDLAKKKDDEKIQDFCSEILKVYEEHNINGHIEWKK